MSYLNKLNQRQKENRPINLFPQQEKEGIIPQLKYTQVQIKFKVEKELKKYKLKKSRIESLSILIVQQVDLI